MHLAHCANLKLLRLIDRTASMRAVTLANQAVRLILAAWLVNHIARTAVTLKETHTERERERERVGSVWLQAPNCHAMANHSTSTATTTMMTRLQNCQQTRLSDCVWLAMIAMQPTLLISGAPSIGTAQATHQLALDAIAIRVRVCERRSVIDIDV
jgi:hypothetical protein